MPTIAEAYVDIGAKLDNLRSGLDRSMSMVRGTMSKMGGLFVSGFGSAITSAMRVVRSVLSNMLSFAIRWARRLSLAIAAGLGISIKLASDAEQTFSKFRLVMGDAADEAERFAKAVGSEVGRSVIDIAEGLSTFQSFFVGMGFASGDALKMSKVLTRLSIDFASFNNISDSEALQRFIAALSGSGEVLDRFGINIKSAALDQELLARGFPKVTQGATEQQKAVARLGIIYRAMGDQGALGNAAETADEFANKLKRLRGELKDLAVDIGKRFLGGSGGIIDLLIRGIQYLRDHLDAIFQFFGRLIDWVIQKVQSLLDWLRKLSMFDEYEGTFFQKFGAAAETAAIKMKFVMLGAWDDVMAEMNRAAIEQMPNIMQMRREGVWKWATTYEATPEDFMRRQVDQPLAELRKLRQQQLEGELMGVRLRNRLDIARSGGAGAGQPGVMPPARPSLPALEFPTISMPERAADIGKQIAKGIIDTISTATGAFKYGQQDRQMRLLETVARKADEQVAATNRVRQAVEALST